LGRPAASATATDLRGTLRALVCHVLPERDDLARSASRPPDSHGSRRHTRGFDSSDRRAGWSYYLRPHHDPRARTILGMSSRRQRSNATKPRMRTTTATRPTTSWPVVPASAGTAIASGTRADLGLRLGCAFSRRRSGSDARMGSPSRAREGGRGARLRRRARYRSCQAAACGLQGDADARSRLPLMMLFCAFSLAAGAGRTAADRCKGRGRVCGPVGRQRPPGRARRSDPRRSRTGRWW
jgi:hypothetical protein